MGTAKVTLEFENGTLASFTCPVKIAHAFLLDLVVAQSAPPTPMMEEAPKELRQEVSVVKRAGLKRRGKTSEDLDKLRCIAKEVANPVDADIVAKYWPHPLSKVQCSRVLTKYVDDGYVIRVDMGVYLICGIDERHSTDLDAERGMNVDDALDVLVNMKQGKGIYISALERGVWNGAKRKFNKNHPEMVAKMLQAGGGRIRICKFFNPHASWKYNR